MKRKDFFLLIAAFVFTPFVGCVFGHTLQPASLDEDGRFETPQSVSFDALPRPKFLSQQLDSWGGVVSKCRELSPKLNAAFHAFEENDLPTVRSLLEESKSVQPQCEALAQALLARVFLFRGKPSALSHHLSHSLIAAAGSSALARARQSGGIFLELLRLNGSAAATKTQTPEIEEEAKEIFSRAQGAKLRSDEACKVAGSGKQSVVADAIVVLGFGLTEAGDLPNRLKERLRRALTLIVENPKALVILTGGGKRLRSEADAMAEFLLARGVGAERLLLDTAARDTLENAENTVRIFHHLARGEITLHQKLLQETAGLRVAVVTDAAHLNRAFPLFEAAAEKAEMASTVPVQWLPVCSFAPGAGGWNSPESGSDEMPLGLLRDLARVNGFWIKPHLFR